MSVNIKLDKRKLEKAIKQQTTSALNSRKYDAKCPHCGHAVQIPTGKSQCPFCRKEIDLSLNINFKG